MPVSFAEFVESFSAGQILFLAAAIAVVGVGSYLAGKSQRRPVTEEERRAMMKELERKLDEKLLLHSIDIALSAPTLEGGARRVKSNVPAEADEVNEVDSLPHPKLKLGKADVVDAIDYPPPQKNVVRHATTAHGD